MPCGIPWGICALFCTPKRAICAAPRFGVVKLDDYFDLKKSYGLGVEAEKGGGVPSFYNASKTACGSCLYVFPYC